MSVRCFVSFIALNWKLRTSKTVHCTDQQSYTHIGHNSSASRFLYRFVSTSHLFTALCCCLLSCYVYVFLFYFFFALLVSLWCFYTFDRQREFVDQPFYFWECCCSMGLFNCNFVFVCLVKYLTTAKKWKTMKFCFLHNSVFKYCCEHTLQIERIIVRQTENHQPIKKNQHRENV